MLRELTLNGEIDKVQIAMNRLRLHEPPEGYYVAFSGGKDSCVVLDLCKRAGVKYDAHYSVTTVDPPELVYFIKKILSRCMGESCEAITFYVGADTAKANAADSASEILLQILQRGWWSRTFCCDWRSTSRECEASKKKINGNMHRTQWEEVHSSDH